MASLACGAARGLLLVLAALLCVAAYFAGAPNVEGDLEGRRLALRDFAYRHLRRSLEPNANVDPEYAASFEESRREVLNRRRTTDGDGGTRGVWLRDCSM